MDEDVAHARISGKYLQVKIGGGAAAAATSSVPPVPATAFAKGNSLDNLGVILLFAILLLRFGFHWSVVHKSRFKTAHKSNEVLGKCGEQCAESS